MVILGSATARQTTISTNMNSVSEYWSLITKQKQTLNLSFFNLLPAGNNYSLLLHEPSCPPAEMSLVTQASQPATVIKNQLVSGLELKAFLKPLLHCNPLQQLLPTSPSLCLSQREFETKPNLGSNQPPPLPQHLLRRQSLRRNQLLGFLAPQESLDSTKRP